MAPSPEHARALLATLRAGRRRIDAIVQNHLPVDRAIAFAVAHADTEPSDKDVLDLVGSILDREVNIWRRSFAARIANQEPPSPRHTPAPLPSPTPIATPTIVQPPPGRPDDGEITLTDADRVRAILDLDEDEPLTAEPAPIEDDEIAWVVEGHTPDEPEAEPEAVDSPPEDDTPEPAGFGFEDEIDRLVLQELERAREEMERSTEPAPEPADADANIEHLLDGPDPLDSPLVPLVHEIDEDSLATGDELVIGLDNISEPEPEPELIAPDDLVMDDLVVEEPEPEPEPESDPEPTPEPDEDADINHLLIGDDLVSFDEPEPEPEPEASDEDDLLVEDEPEAEAEAEAEDDESIRHLLDGDDLVSFDEPEPEPEEADEGDEGEDDDIRHLLDSDDLISFDEPEPGPDVLPPLPEDLLDPEPDEEATVMVQSPLIPSADEEATVMAKGPIVFVPKPEPKPEPEPAVEPQASPRRMPRARPRVAPRSADEEQEGPSEIEEAPTPSWSRQGERETVGEESSEAPRAAAVQLLGGLGQARTVGHTLELESAEQPLDAFEEEDDLEAGDADDSSGGSELSVTLEEEYEEVAPIPQLTDTSAPLSLTADAPEEEDDVSEDDLARALRRARETERSGDLQGAILLYSDLIDLDPLDAQSRLGRGRCLMEMADYAAAMSDFQRAEDLSPESAEPPFEMGNLFYARKDYRRAITFYTQAINADPGQALARVRRGMSFFYRRDYNKALADLERAQSLEPNMPGLAASINKVTRALRR